MNLYNLRLLAPNKFALAKFDDDFNVEAVYNLEPKGHSYTCDCPANQRSVVTKPCKHKRMMPLMLGACNTDRFFDPDTGNWLQPLGDIDRPQAKPPIASEASLLEEVQDHARRLNEGNVPDPVYVKVPEPSEPIPTAVPVAPSQPTIRRR